MENVVNRITRHCRIGKVTRKSGTWLSEAMRREYEAGLAKELAVYSGGGNSIKPFSMWVST